MFTPLSESDLCEAMIISPMIDLVFNNLKEATIPVLNNVDDKSEASDQNLVVP